MFSAVKPVAPLPLSAPFILSENKITFRKNFAFFAFFLFFM